jgi:cytidylate kinase
MTGMSRQGDAASTLPRERLIITIDGPAGTGKSSVARALANRLGLEFLDTGAMYRAAAAIALDRAIPASDAPSIVAALARTDIRFDWTTDPPTLLADGQSMMHRIRASDVTAVVSPVAGIPELRQIMVALQRRIGEQHPRLVTEGRDQGSVVFPNADVKFFLFASPEVRARRRAEQLQAAGQPADFERLKDEIIERDRSDSTRRDGPLTCPAGAIRVDTSNLSFDEVVATLERLVAEELARSSGRAWEGDTPAGTPASTKKNARVTVGDPA